MYGTIEISRYENYTVKKNNVIYLFYFFFVRRITIALYDLVSTLFRRRAVYARVYKAVSLRGTNANYTIRNTQRVSFVRRRRNYCKYNTIPFRPLSNYYYCRNAHMRLAVFRIISIITIMAACYNIRLYHILASLFAKPNQWPSCDISGRVLTWPV